MYYLKPLRFSVWMVGAGSQHFLQGLVPDTKITEKNVHKIGCRKCALITSHRKKHLKALVMYKDHCPNGTGGCSKGDSILYVNVPGYGIPSSSCNARDSGFIDGQSSYSCNDAEFRNVTQSCCGKLPVGEFRTGCELYQKLGWDELVRDGS
jgi:hypothetical protein